MGQVPVNRPIRRLAAILRIEYRLENLTGLLIRMPISAQVYRIGGADIYPMVTVRRYSIGGLETELEIPYIPGSSLKGRMRSLVEEALASSLYSSDGKIWMHARFYSDKGKEGFAMSPDELVEDIASRCVVDEVFGAPAIHADTIKELLELLKNKELLVKFKIGNYLQLYSNIAQTRLLVDDAFPDQGYVNRMAHELGRHPSLADFLEDKSENRLDRVTSAADPRVVVRIKPGVIFSGCLRMLFFDIDRGYVKRNLLAALNAMKLVEETYLGGSGSRGYGRVRFKDLSLVLLRVGPQALAEEHVGKYTSVSDLIGKVDEIANKIESSLEAQGKA